MALAAGDIAIVSMNADINKIFSFVALVDIPAGEVVKFTDNGWLSTNAFRTGEGVISWTAPVGGVLAGAVVTINTTSTTTSTVDIGSVVDAGDVNFSTGGDQVTAYQGLEAAPTFLFGVNNEGAAVWQATAADSNTSALPSGLTNGTNAVALTELDNYRYNGTTTGTKSVLLAAISNPANWLGDDANNLTAPTSFTVQTVVLPTVNLSVSTNIGSEAGITLVTVTATASAAVTGAQTVALAVTGTNITAGDYNLSNTVITIANGATTGTVTFTVLDDVLAEALETAVLTISGPSAGISLGGTLTQNIAITDNDAAPSLVYTNPTLSESNAYLGGISGKTIITLTGDTFTGANGENLITAAKVGVTNFPTGLTAVLIRTSATTAELSYTGTATPNANANDVPNVTVTFANTAFTGANAASITASTKADLGINFADIGTAGTVQTFTPNAGTTRGSSDASTAIALDANFMVVGDDEANVLRVYDRAGGPAVLEYSYASIDPLLVVGELDLEASTRIGDTLYFMGSHSNSRTGNEANNREFIFSVTVSGTGANTVFTTGGKYGGLEGALSTWDSSNAHTKGANYFGFTASSVAGVAPETTGGFSIEGMTASQDSTQLFLAFRAPQTTTTARDKAVIVPVTVASIFTGTPVFGAPIELNLGGRGIRSIEKSSGGTDYLILAGPAGSASTYVTNDFRLFRWDGVSTTPTELNVNLDVLRDTTLGSFESIVDVQSTAGGTLVQLLQDNGDTDWADRVGTAVSKDLLPADQKFQGNWISIGADVPADLTAPVLVSATPADDATAVAVNADLVLRFNEGMKAGIGNFIIKKVSDNSVVETIAVGDAAKVNIAFNTVTINPTANLDSSTAYYVEAAAGTLVDTAGNNWAGLTGNAAYNFTTVAGATTLAAGDVLFMSANADPTDSFAFVLTKAITTGTQIGFSDRDYSNATGFPITGESAYLWTADQAYAAGTIITIRPDASSPSVDKGTVQGAGGGLSANGETVYAFQGSIAGLGVGTAGAITATTFLASINVGGLAAGDIPASLTAVGASISFAQDNAIYVGPLDRGDAGSLATFVTAIKNPANYFTSNTVSSTLVGNALFGGPLLNNGVVNGNSVTLNFFDPLNAALPAVGAFTVKVNGVAVASPTGISSAGNAITLTLAAPVASSNTVTISYADPTIGVDDANAVQSTAGDDSFSFTDRALTNTTPVPAVGTSLVVPYLEPFTFNLADFASFSVDADGVNKWLWNTTTPASAAVNGFGNTAPANDWLISKGFDMSQTAVEYMSFTTFTAFADPGVAYPQVKLRYSTNYSGSGSPDSATWTDLSYTPSASASSVITPSGPIDLSAIVGTNVFFAFQYTASGTGNGNSSSWHLDDFSLEGYNGPVFSIAPLSAVKAEGSAGTTPFTFTVTRGGSTALAASVNYAVTGAADAADFVGGVLPAGTLNFAIGESSQILTVNVSGDLTTEVTENFTVTLSAPVNAVLSLAPTAAATIQTDDVTIALISAIQGTGTTAALAGVRYIEGIVTAFVPGLQGFYVQEEAADSDGNPLSSEGIFVFYGNSLPLGLSAATVGDVVRVGGTVAEFNNLTQISGLTLFSVITDNVGTAAVPAPVLITLPVVDQINWESVEGMLVTVSSATAGPTGRLVVTDNFNYGRYGQVTLTSDTLLQTFSETTVPNVAGYTAYISTTRNDQLVLDDSLAAQNTNVIARGGNPLSATNTLRAGDFIASVTGVIDQSTANPTVENYQTSYRIQATAPVSFAGDARPTAASLPAQVTGAEIKVASVNVLNYFTTVGPTGTTFVNPNGTTHDARGANTAAEFTRQKDKLVSNILGLNADVVGLMEMQNNGFGDGTSGIDSLVDALNAVAGAGTYAYIAGPYPDGNGAPSVTAGNDAIMVAFLYKPAKVSIVGAAAVPDILLLQYDAFTSTYGSRVPVAVTFKAAADGEEFTVVSNHFKSKGSTTPTQGVDLFDGAGNANIARDRASTQLITWLGTNPTGSLDTDVLLIGDFNAYSKEQPITTLIAGGYTKVSTGLSYSFNGLWGSLDHALSSTSLTTQVTGAVKWGINAEEPTVLDYNTEFKSAGQVTSFYAPDAYRSSDHNPVLIGLNLDSPVVNLSVSSNAGSEATAATAITVTATAAATSTIARSVTVAVTGTGITAGDFALSNTTLTIAAGALTGTVNFNVVDDALSEGSETAVVTISAPTSGFKLGTTVTQNIVITDNEAAPPAPTPAPPAPAPTPAPAPVPAPVPPSGLPSAAVENAAPGLAVGGNSAVAGDANGDGLQDSTQAGVVSISIPLVVAAPSPGTPGAPAPSPLPSPAPAPFITLVADSSAGKPNTGIAATPAQVTSFSQQTPAAGSLPATLKLPVGVIATTTTVSQVGLTETFSLYVDSALTPANGYFVKNAAGTWINLASAPVGGQTMMEGGKLRLDYQITDGGQFDADGKADGIITQAGAPGTIQLSLVGLPSDNPAPSAAFII